MGEPRSRLADAASEVVRELTSSSPAHIRKLRGGVMNNKYLVTVSEETRFVVRFYARGNANAVTYEPDLIRTLKGHGLPVATLIGDSRSGPSAPLPYMAYEYLPGEALRSQLSRIALPARRRIARQIAEFLQSLGSLQTTGYGDLQNSGTGRFGTWIEFIEASLDEGISAATRHDSLPLEVIHHIDVIRARIECFDPPARPELAWGDILINNVLVDSNHLSGIVDFEGTLAAEYALNLGYARAAYGLSAQFARHLIDASTHSPQQQDLDRLDLYTVLRGARVSRFAHLPLPTGLRRRSVLAVFPGVKPAAQNLAERLGI